MTLVEEIATELGRRAGDVVNKLYLNMDPNPYLRMRLRAWEEKLKVSMMTPEEASAYHRPF